VSSYLTELAGHGAKVGTMSRRRSALRFAHQLHNLPSPTTSARVEAVWEGIRRTHGAPPDESAPLEPPELFQVVDACPTTKVWRTRGREPEPSLAGARDRALLLDGFVGAFRRSELAGFDVEHISNHPKGLVVAIPRSKENQTDEEPELVVLPRAATLARCPVHALDQWLDLAAITSGPVFRKVTKSNMAAEGGLHPESINKLVQTAIARADIDPEPYSAHSLRAGFVTYSQRRGASDQAVAHQTRHRSLASVGTYIRIDEAWEDNAATQLGF
jgi:integrase